MTPATSRRLRLFATTQIAFSFVLLAGASTLVASLIALRSTETGYDMEQVLAIDLPMKSLGFSTPQELTLYQEIARRVGELPGVDGVSLGNMTPWRDPGFGSPQFTAEGFTPENGEENPHARFRIAQPGFFHTLGIPLLAGRDFTADDAAGREAVVVVSQSVAQRVFPDGDALNRKLWWTDPYFGPKPFPRRIIGVVGDVDDMQIVPGTALAVYHPFLQMPVAGRLFVRAEGDPYALVRPITKIVRDLDPTQPIERPATLEDIRAEVLMPERINAFVFSGFAGVALLIAVVGVSGVLAFGVSARTREFGVRLAIGSSPYKLLLNVLREGAFIVAIGLIAGAIGGYAFAGIASGYFNNLQLPGAVTVLAATGVMVLAALIASLMPAARASRVDVLQALRAE